MDTQARAKLRAWLKRPRGSFGWIAAIATLVLAASVYQALSPVWRLPMRTPAVLLALFALSAAVGWAVQRSVKRMVGNTIFTGGAIGWQARLKRIRAVARESNILLAMLALMAGFGAGTLWLAGRTVENIVNACEANFQAQAAVPQNAPIVAQVAKPVCQCLAQTFLDRNGVIRLALFNTPLLDASTLKGVTAIDERRCLEQLDLLL
ncbi:hypothetical protein C163_13400 [Pseudomonas sp. FGI182]|uniref:hypothetical protein n=1 Tax=Pseudomonas sp. FGI182 TaxID=1259844 RepID=UPI0003D95E4B|nr:hypothetical protein [Pseudomonas sp. FGI182]AHD14686.1 hypothetical protein C163_13400 [Pseudomonas sp. FGI182]